MSNRFVTDHECYRQMTDRQRDRRHDRADVVYTHTRQRTISSRAHAGLGTVHRLKNVSPGTGIAICCIKQQYQAKSDLPHFRCREFVVKRYTQPIKNSTIEHTHSPP